MTKIENESRSWIKVVMEVRMALEKGDKAGAAEIMRKFSEMRETGAAS